MPFCEIENYRIIYCSNFGRQIHTNEGFIQKCVNNELAPLVKSIIARSSWTHWRMARDLNMTTSEMINEHRDYTDKDFLKYNGKLLKRLVMFL